MNRKRHVYRIGNRFYTSERPRGFYVGYFELRRYDGIESWSWTWARHAQRDRHANEWLVAERNRLNEAHKRDTALPADYKRGRNKLYKS